MTQSMTRHEAEQLFADMGTALGNGDLATYYALGEAFRRLGLLRRSHHYYERYASELEGEERDVPDVGGVRKPKYEYYRDYFDTGRIEFARRQDRLSARDVDDVRIDPGGTAGWAVASLGAEREIGAAWRLGMDIGNLLDERYRRHGSGLETKRGGVAEEHVHLVDRHV